MIYVRLPLRHSPSTSALACLGLALSLWEGRGLGVGGGATTIINYALRGVET